MKTEGCESFAKQRPAIKVNKQDYKETRCSFVTEGREEGRKEGERDRGRLGKQSASLF